MNTLSKEWLREVENSTITDIFPMHFSTSALRGILQTIPTMASFTRKVKARARVGLQCLTDTLSK